MEYVYILECGDGSYYTGWTVNIENRIKMHREGKGAKYTRGRGPIKLVYKEVFENRSDALKRENEIKRMSKTKKKALIAFSLGSVK